MTNELSRRSDTPPEDALADQELAALVRQVFRPRASDRSIAVLVDLPDERIADEPAWVKRRQLAVAWVNQLRCLAPALGLDPYLYLYRNVKQHNADLPTGAYQHRGGPLAEHADELDLVALDSFSSIFSTHTILLALTQFSATAPLKVAARRYGFRAASMPGFTPAMISALRLDYTVIHDRVVHLKRWLDRAIGAEIVFAVTGNEFCLHLDLRYRTGHASGGLITEPGTAANLPSGEACIVPYEGERPGESSQSKGILPVQLGAEVVFFRVEENRAVAVESDGEESRQQAEYLSQEPAYGNLAELGLGILSDFGLCPIGEMLLDEKLGLHIAFGRSDHFGGQVGAAHFTRPEAVVHIDRVFLPETQPKVCVRRVALWMPDGDATTLIRGGRYTDDFSVAMKTLKPPPISHHSRRDETMCQTYPTSSRRNKRYPSLNSVPGSTRVEVP